MYELTYNTTASKYANLALELDIARKAGFSSVEIIAPKVNAYLNAHHSKIELNALFSDLEVKGIGALLDIERQDADLNRMLLEAEQLFKVAKLVNSKGVQIVTGPLDFRAVENFNHNISYCGYQGLLKYSLQEKFIKTSTNLKLLADLAKDYGLIIYLEALCWTPLNTLDHQQKLLEMTNRDNVKIVLDFWHSYVSGDGPESISKLNPEFLYGVHVCDALPYMGGVPNEELFRDIETGQGILPLQELVDAVKTTGYSGWWCSETFSKKQQQENSYEVAIAMKKQLDQLINS
ncbi:sugar phosphate isomerase/epimerase [Acinetobacter baumannii]|uniref:sugar phosphate isomerase/epimerase family protein n=1 Tax=Acinetobacter baumannii TaxID=470 RepID=UPI00244987A5|nr:sugar phosphate isomerase/epimerase [Acinetobacter baumannii]MDH2622537.1 sugar phosphate isomerase/epimerase [Acinetobacter baumannii]